MIFFTHTGPIPLYLTAAILQAQTVSPNQHIILLTDQAKNPVPQALRASMAIAKIDDYFDSAAAFAEIFRFEGRNSYEYELWNFQRWFVIEEYARVNKVEEPLLHLDSDAFLYIGPASVIPALSADLSVCDVSGPQFVFMKSRRSLHRYTTFISDHFSTDEGFQQLQDYVSKSNLSGLPHVSDMVSLGLFGETNEVEDIGSPSRSDFQFCENIGSSQGLRMGLLGKKMRVRNGVPSFVRLDGSLIPAGGVHLQGGNKALWPFFASFALQLQIVRHFPRGYANAISEALRKALLAMSLRPARLARKILAR